MDFDQLEAFALGENDERERALELLVPGTEDHFYYQCLLHQHRGEHDRVEPLLEAWISRFGWTERARSIRERQVFLDYNEGAPKKTLETICDDLGLRFDHQRESEARDQVYPTSLAQELIERDAFEREIKAYDADISSYTDLAFDWLLDRALDSPRRRELLTRLRRPDYPRLVDHVVADLDTKDSGGFGSLLIHGLMLLDQLEELAKRMPDVLDSSAFINMLISRLQPNPDADWENDHKEKGAYLDRLWSVVNRLSPSFNSLKVHVLYHRLELERSMGVYDREQFLTYLALPRQVWMTSEKLLRHPKHRHVVADLSADYQTHTLLPAVVNDESLVRDFLARFLVDADDYKAFSGLIRDDVLVELFAETKILAGRSDPERWTSMLDPARYQALKERVDIDLAPQNSTCFRADEPVTLEVDIKNVQTLLVKVFEVNALNTILTTGREVDTSIDLDGMVAGVEEVSTYEEPPLRRVRRSFTFDQLKKPGVYVVELIGSGKSSRALIRKGSLRFLERLGAAGHVFTILDEDGRVLPEATLWLGGREYEAGDDGTIRVPFTTTPRPVDVVLRYGDLAALETFNHRDERYTFDVSVHVDREQLLSRRKATALVRPSLSIHGVPVDLSLVEKPVLHLLTTDRRGIEADLDIPVVLSSEKEIVQEFTVPEELSVLSITVTGTVRSVTTQTDIDLQDGGEEIRVNEIDRQPFTEDLHFSRTKGGYVLSLLGKSGEPRCAKPVNLTVRHRHFNRDLYFTLQTDDRGRIELGELDEIASVHGSCSSGVGKHLVPHRPWSAYPSVIHAIEGETIEIPLPGSVTGRDALLREVSLLEWRGSGYVRSCIEAAKLDEGAVVIQGLEAGDYLLALKQRGARITLRVTRGVERRGWTVAEHRMLELSRRRPLLIRRIEATDEALNIHLGNASPSNARVHVIATRFAPFRDAAHELSPSNRTVPGSALFSKAISHYVSGRDIGDEYRYILERKYSPTFAGTMLSRPSLLLNPWAISSTEMEKEGPAAGGAYGASPRRQPRARSAREAALKRKLGGVMGGEALANLDFLTSQSVVLSNLRADENGVVAIERSALESASSVHVVAIDSDGALQVDQALDEPTMGHRDVRLLNGLDPASHFTEQKQASVLRHGEELTIDDISTASVESFETLGDVYNLLATLCRSEHFDTFRFIVEWPMLSESDQRARYSECACHELNLFLSFKDRSFFESVVVPYLRNKLHKTFMDRYLLGDDLDAYRETWSFSRLNVVERILLSWRVEAEREPIRRHIEELFECLAPDPDEEDRLFTAALKAGGPGGGGLGFAEAQDQTVMAMTSTGVVGGVAGFSRAEPAGAMAYPQAAPAAPPPPPAPAGRGDMLSVQDEATGEFALSESLALDAPFGAEDNGLVDSRTTTLRSDVAARDEVRRLYRRQDTTQEWAENNYYKLRIYEQGPELVTVNAFWRDLVQHDPAEPFHSPHFHKVGHSFTEALCALAVLDLPFEKPEHEVTYDEGTMRLKAAGPVVIFRKEIEAAELPAQKAPLMITQNYLRSDDRFIYEGDEYREKHVTGEFLVHVVYESQVVLINPTSAQQKLDLLLQIPAGSVPVADSTATRGRPLTLEPFSGTQITTFFYFPHPGQFSQFPAHAAEGGGGKLLAGAESKPLVVVEELTEVDKESWAYLSQHAEAEEVLRFLDDHNLERLDLDLIAWRMRDPAFYRSVIAALRRRHVYHNTLWSYGLKHGVQDALKEFLRHQDDLLRSCGPWFESGLISIDPVRRGWYEHLEYSPLINARAHRLGGKTSILTDAFERQYRQFLEALCTRPKLESEDLLAAAYYLLLQDRVGESMEAFAKVARGDVASTLQYEYLGACLALHEADPRAARRLAEPHVDHPVDRWRNRFQAVIAVIDEAEGASIRVADKDDRDAEQTRLADSEASFDLTVEKGALTLTYQNLTECSVSYYLMDIELLFSRQPFVQQQAERFSLIRPNRSDVVKLPSDQDELTLDLPVEYRAKNVIVEIVAQGQRKVVASYAHSLIVRVVHQYGQVLVTERGAGKPVVKAYVKVYSRDHAGEVSFYKDGYTDLRGRFDYATLSTDDIDRVERFALLVLSDELGAVVTEAPKPAL